MATITTADRTEIFHKDWGAGQPIAVHVGHSTCGDEVAHYIARHGERNSCRTGRSRRTTDHTM